jgi:3-oxoacyl-[acyl-carrier protein] reductase
MTNENAVITIRNNIKHQLKHKCAWVTGGSHGTGAAMVRRLACQGAHTTLTHVGNPDPDQANEAVRAPQGLDALPLAIQANTADAKAAVANVEQMVIKMGGIHILVNNAGIAAIAPIGDYRREDLDRTLVVNDCADSATFGKCIYKLAKGGQPDDVGRIWKLPEDDPGFFFHHPTGAIDP